MFILCLIKNYPEFFRREVRDTYFWVTTKTSCGNMEGVFLSFQDEVNQSPKIVCMVILGTKISTTKLLDKKLVLNCQLT